MSDPLLVRFVCRDEYGVVHDDFLLCSGLDVDPTDGSPPSGGRWGSAGDRPATAVLLSPHPQFADSDRLSSKSINDSVESRHRCAAKGIRLDGYSYSLFKYILETRPVYRTLVAEFFTRRFTGGVWTVRVRLLSPERHVLDPKWNDMILVSALERRELETAMSWLSTLGGAFSSLGDEAVHCALAAGRISARQLRLALRLGDPMTVIRCKLYLAISLVQTKRFRLAASIVRAQYALVHTFRAADARVVAMCLGIWAKLKYEKSLYKSRAV